VDKPLSVTHGQYDARPTVTFPAQAGTHCAYPQRDGQAELAGGWLHIDIVYPPEDGYPSGH